MNRGRIASAIGGGAPVVPAGPLDPLTIVGGTILSFLIADLGVVAGSPLTWADQSASGNSLTSGVAPANPAYTAVDATLNNRGSVLADGVDDTALFTTLNLPAPGTTNIWIWAIFKPVSWTNNDDLYTGNSATVMRLTQSTTTPQMVATNGTVGTLNGGATIGAWCRSEHLFSNSVADYLKIGAVSVTGVNTGNGDAAAGLFRLFARSGAGFGNYALAAMLIRQGDPGAPAKAALDTWVAAYYGGGVAL